MLDDIIPFPKEERTPPVIKMYFKTIKILKHKYTFPIRPKNKVSPA